MQNFEYQFSHKQLTLVVTLEKSSSEIKESDVVEHIKQSKYAALSILNEKVKALVKTANTELSDVKKGKRPNSEVKGTVAKAVDAHIKIVTASDKMSVEAHVTTAMGGEKLNLETIKQACIDTGIRYGLKSSLIDELLTKCQQATPGSVVSQVIVKGLAVIQGKDAHFEPRVQLFSELFRTPKVNADGRVDLKDLGSIETVPDNTFVLEKVPLTDGVEGIDVYGDKIQPTPGKDANFVLNESVKVNPDNPNSLFSAREGLARFDGKEMIIDDTFILPELDPKKGHIKFKGSVIIQGDVSPEMHLAATGDVLIGGFVESAVIKCGGELTILSGASGRLIEGPKNDHHYTCTLQSGGQINLEFANQCEITAKSLVNIKRQLTHCNVEANSVVVGQGDRPNGQISGGHFFLCKTLEAGTIGTESDVHTDISMNRTYDIFIKKEQELSDWIQEMVNRFEKVEMEFNGIVDPVKKAELEPELTKLQSKIEKYSGYRTALISKRREYMAEVSVKANTKLHPKVAFFITDHKITNETEKGPTIIQLEEYELKMTPLV